MYSRNGGSKRSFRGYGLGSYYRRKNLDILNGIIALTRDPVIDI